MCVCAFVFSSHFYSLDVFGQEIVRGTAAPVHNVFVLAPAAQFSVPVCDAEVGTNKRVTEGTIAKHSVEERLKRKEGEGRRGKWREEEVGRGEGKRERVRGDG